MAVSAEKLANIRLFHEEIHSPRGDGSTSNTPLLLGIEPTARCNFQCVHCPTSFIAQKPADMNWELFQDMVPLLPAAHELYLFGDGEVLLDMPRHLAMVARAYQEDPRCALGFSTNGKLLTPEVYELYSAAGIQYIQLSVDAATRELYETMRRGGRFDELLANLEAIAALRRRTKTRQPELRLATVISKQNYQQLPLLAEFARRYGFSYWYIISEYPHNPGRDRLRLTPEDLAELERLRADLLKTYSSSYFTVFDPCIGLPPDRNQKWLQTQSNVFCTVPWQRFELKANEDVKICPYYHKPVCSMNGKTFSSVWNGIEFRRIRQAFTSGTDIPSYCIDCKLGMRKQYLPGYPGLPETTQVSRFSPMLRRFRTSK
jgi:MoaA/NifB/PqqE/SkfB family radical SAM enzyme